MMFTQRTIVNYYSPDVDENMRTEAVISRQRTESSI